MNERKTGRMILCGIVGFLIGVSFQTPSPVGFDHRNKMDFELHSAKAYSAGLQDGKAIERMGVEP